MSGMFGMFIDGVGNTAVRECDGSPWVKVVIPQRKRAFNPTTQLAVTAKSTHDVAVFERIGTMPDGTHVYAQQEAKLQYWRYRIEVDLLKPASDVARYIQEAEEKLALFIGALGAPVKVLHDRHSTRGGYAIRVVEGVGRKR